MAVFHRRSPIAIPEQTDRRAEPEQRVATGLRARRAAEREAAQRAAEQAERELRVARARRRMAQVTVAGLGSAPAGPATGPIPTQIARPIPSQVARPISSQAAGPISSQAARLISAPISLPAQRTESVLPPPPRSA